jgi:hypothetical protein
MPLVRDKDNQGCFVKWGEQGHKYYYKCGNNLSRKFATKKALAQAVAIGEFIQDKISFDFDDTLSRASVRDIAKRYISKGTNVYVISARNDASVMYDITDKLGIPRSRVFATGSNQNKVDKIKSLGITKHYDNNSDVIKKIGSIGELVKLSTHDIFSDYIKFAKTYNDYPQQATENAKIALRWAEKNGWGDCGTPVGKARANQLANREGISEDTIARMSAFERQRQNSDRELGDGCGRLMWLAWGGDAGVEWANRKLKQIRNNN